MYSSFIWIGVEFLIWVIAGGVKNTIVECSPFYLGDTASSHRLGIASTNL